MILGTKNPMFIFGGVYFKDFVGDEYFSKCFQKLKKYTQTTSGDEYLSFLTRIGLL